MKSGPRAAASLRPLLPLFFVSLFSLAFETLLTRYFAVALFSEYSYWIISIAMVGYSLSGVLLTMLNDHFLRRRGLYFLLIPPLLLGFSVLALFILQVNPFNPLKLQNPVLWKTQVAEIFLYYAGLFPVFFLAGMFVGLSFLVYYRQVTRAYAFDLLGAAAGTVVILVAMFILHPYHLVAVVLPAAFVAVALGSVRRFGTLLAPRSLLLLGVSLAGLGAGMYYVFSISPLSAPVFKRLFPIFHISNTRVIDSRVDPSGFYLVMSDYLEFDDVNMTNNYSFLNIGAPPRSYGLYKDDDRVAPLLQAIPTDLSYVKGSLSDFPYTIRSPSSALLVGTNGGYKILERAAVGAAGVALEQQRVPYELIRERFRELEPDYEGAYGFGFRNESVFGYLRSARPKFRVIEVSRDFLNQDPNNEYSFTQQAVELYLRALEPGGILSIPVDISHFSVYALKVVNTVISALARVGIADPADYVIVYRTEWASRILVSNRPFSASDIEKLKKFCDDRSFDTSYYPGIDPATVTIWNSLPPISFSQGTVQVSSRPQDALMNDLTQIFSPARASFYSRHFFDLSPATLDRPNFYSISRLSKLRALLSKISIMPEQEVGYVINVVVLAQALVFALIILFLPLATLRRSRRREALSGVLFLRLALYFTALGLGFFFVELALIKKFTFFLESATTSFAVVLSTMLVFSGLGSWYGYRFQDDAYRGMLRALPIIAVSLGLAIGGLDALMLAAVQLPGAVKIPIVVVAAAPLSFAMGRFFPLGTFALGVRSEALVPWAWSVNGAFSVIATPLANIFSARIGWTPLLAAALVLYLTTILTFPARPPRARQTL
jgi:hypothetical protein